MIFLVINFHYIHEDDKFPYPGIYATPPDRFTNQLDRLAQHFDFISQNDVVDALEGRKKLPKRSCLITCDDGLKSQYENALPILQKKGIPAVFFVHGLPYKEKKACLVHKIHWLRANLPPQDFVKEIDQGLRRVMKKPLDYFLTRAKIEKGKYRYDEPEIAKLKFILNCIVPEKYRERVVDEIFQKVVGNEARFCERFYMSEKEISHLHQFSFLGIHSFAHRPLSQLSRKQLKEDIGGNLEVVYRIIGNKNIHSISYPYGNHTDFSPQVIPICKSFGLKCGFTGERAFNRTLEQPFLFARLDTNDAPGGKNLTFDFRSTRLTTFQGTTSRRRVYFEENYD